MLGGTAGLWVGGCVSTGAVAHTPSPLSGAALYADLQTYAAFGAKRTGSVADRAVSTWMRAEAERLGARVIAQPFRVRQFDLKSSGLSLPDGELLTYPFWFPQAGDVAAPLTFDWGKARGKILVVDLPEGPGALRLMPSTVLRAQAAGAAALVIVTRTPSGEPFAHGQTATCALPTLIAGDRGLARLREAEATGQNARLWVSGEVEEAAEAENVVAQIGNAGPLIVVSTPTSAWTAAGGERGPGVALWRGLLRRAAASPQQGRWLFTAFSGHELDGAGSRAFLASDLAPPPSSVAAWCHLGASIATRRFIRSPDGRMTPTERAGDAVRLLTNQPGWLDRLRTAFEPAVLVPRLVSPDQPARGELQLYFGRGFPAFGFEGPHDYFHAPGDTAASSGPNFLAPVAAALDAFLSEMTR